LWLGKVDPDQQPTRKITTSRVERGGEKYSQKKQPSQPLKKTSQKQEAQPQRNRDKVNNSKLVEPEEEKQGKVYNRENEKVSRNSGGAYEIPWGTQTRCKPKKINVVIQKRKRQITTRTPQQTWEKA